jgi:hypothetical protein
MGSLVTQELEEGAEMGAIAIIDKVSRKTRKRNRIRLFLILIPD